MTYRDNAKRHNDFFLASVTIDEIQAHNRKVRNATQSIYLPCCPRCRLDPAEFKRHDLRERQFLVLVKQIVKTTTGFLIKWRCPGCAKTFTEYPWFALPHKRYTLPTIFNFCHRYVTEPKISYRKLMRQSPVGYGVENNDERLLEHTTIYRWITSLGNLCRVSRRALCLILQANPMSAIHRNLAAMVVSRKKYRSELRKQILLRCLKLLKLELCFHNDLGVSIFPKLATGCAFA